MKIGLSLRAQGADKKKSVKQIEVLRSSSLLDPIWYREHYADLSSSPLDVAVHYLNHGAAEGRNPGPRFDTQLYLTRYPDVKASGMNPLVHFILYGEAEGRSGFLGFDESFYARLYPDFAASGLTAEEHYKTIGRDQFRHARFDPRWYRSEYDLPSYSDIEAEEHFFEFGRAHGFHPSFNPDWYRSEYQEIADAEIEPYSHYVNHGAKEGRHASFDRDFYLREYPDIANSTIDPYEHYVAHGRAENRYPAFNRGWYSATYKEVSNLELDPYTHYSSLGRLRGFKLSPRNWATMSVGAGLRPISDYSKSISLYGTPPTASSSFVPKVSVIVPNFNHGPFLRERLDSIYSQTYRNFEVILLDDCSGDDSVSILSEYAEIHSERTIRVFNETNSGGVFLQWKRGLELSTGELVWIAESDDFCTSNFLQELVRFFINPAVKIAFARTDFVQGDPLGRIWTSEDYLSEIQLDLGSQPVIRSAAELVNSGWGARNIIPNVSASVFRNPGRMRLFDDPNWLQLRMCGDWVFYMHLARGGLVGYSPNTTNFYRRHEDNTSISIHDKDIYYKEHETTAIYMAELFKADRQLISAHEEVLYRHWCMKRGEGSREQFEKLFSISKVLDAAKRRSPNITVAVYALVAGGGETFPINLANLLNDSGYSVSVLNFAMQPTNIGVRQMLHPSIPLLEPANNAVAAAILADLCVEVVHSHHSWVDITLANQLRRHPHIQQVITLHGMYELMDVSEVEHYQESLDRVREFVYIADKNLSHFSEDFRSSTNWTKITNTVPKSPSNCSTPALSPISSNGDFIVCLASRAVEEKGWEEAIQAVVWANSQPGRKIRLRLVGDGPVADRLQKQQLPEFIELLGFQSNVTEIFSGAHVGLLASRFKGESCPLVLIECLNAGRPMIATDVGEVHTMLSSDRGLAGALHTLVDWRVDVSNLAAVLRNLADDTSEYQRMLDCVPSAAAKFDPQAMLDRYLRVYRRAIVTMERPASIRPRVSVVLVTYNMSRELPRTLFTFGANYQKGIDPCDYEIIVVDNASTQQYDWKDILERHENIRVCSYIPANQSPVDALNFGISLALGEVICACIDGARMASPGLVALGFEACKSAKSTVVGSYSFHLGHLPQNDSVNLGYDQSVEDQLLKTIDWQNDGYSLFSIASFDPSSRFGLSKCPAETNAIFMTREKWLELGGFDELFVGRGGGLANLDLWKRLCQDPDNNIVMLMGEGTFHQFHGGTATNAPESPWGEFHDEYMKIRGVEYSVPTRRPYLYGTIRKELLEFAMRIEGALA
jgi:glycosyltransferase involved in cell wall biosynthesis